MAGIPTSFEEHLTAQAKLCIVQCSSCKQIPSRPPHIVEDDDALSPGKCIQLECDRSEERR